MNPISKLKPGQSAILARIGSSGTAMQKLLRYGLLAGAPISRYAATQNNKGGVWRQGSLLIAMRKKDADHLMCFEEDNPNE